MNKYAEMMMVTANKPVVIEESDDVSGGATCTVSCGVTCVNTCPSTCGITQG